MPPSDGHDLREMPETPPAAQGPEPLHPVVVGEDEADPRGSAPGAASGHAATEHRGSEKETADNPVDAVEQPAKVMRIGAMTRQLLEEVRSAPLDEASRARLKDIYETSIRELASSLSPDLANELDRLALPFEDSAPSDAELRVAQAQLVGWLEGLFHGIQATLFAQQMAARSQLEDFRQRGLPPGAQPGPDARPGNYL
jgi:hypothetical protein